jgi:hypothetical protein
MAGVMANPYGLAGIAFLVFLIVYILLRLLTHKD